MPPLSPLKPLGPTDIRYSSRQLQAKRTDHLSFSYIPTRLYACFDKPSYGRLCVNAVPSVSVGAISAPVSGSMLLGIFVLLSMEVKFACIHRPSNGAARKCKNYFEPTSKPLILALPALTGRVTV